VLSRKTKVAVAASLSSISSGQNVTVTSFEQVVVPALHT
jgi:hypothetical protein